MNPDALNTLKSLTLLCVDDEPDALFGYNAWFQALVKKVITAENGQIAIELFESEKPDLVITDIQMPVMTGLEMSRILREQDPDLAIIAISAYNETEYFQQAIDLGINHFLIKPVKKPQLVKMLETTSERIRLKRKLRQTQRLMESITDSIGEGICVTDLEGHVEYVNDAFKKMFSFETAGLISEEVDSVLKGFFHLTEETSFKNRITESISESAKKSFTATMIKNGCRCHSILIINIHPRIEHEKAVGCVMTFSDVTETVKTQERLDILQEGIEQNPVTVVITDTKGIIEYANPVASAVSGYSMEEMLGKRTSLFKSGRMSQTFYENLWKTISSGHVWQGELENKRKNGEFYWENAVISPIRDSHGIIHHFIAVKEDITQKRAFERQIKEQSDQFIQAINEAPLPIMIHAENGEVLLINKAWIEISGYNPDEIKTIDSWTERAYGPKKESARKTIAGLFELSSRFNQGEFIITTKSGESRNWQFSSAPLGTSHNGLKLVISMATDLTTQRKTELALLEKEELMIAQSRHAAMGEMISMIAHQWRQPITAIGMTINNVLADIELEAFDVQNAKECGKSVMEQIHYLSRTIDDFRDFFRPDKSLETVTASTLIDDAVNIIEKSFLNKGISLTRQIHTDPTISLYRGEMLQVLLNILINAKDVSSERNIQNPEVTIMATTHGKTIRICVADNAGGVPAHIKDKIFEPYFSTKDEKTGTGLGLYMSKIIVEKHLGGELVFNNTDKGANFCIILPLSKEDGEKN